MVGGVFRNPDFVDGFNSCRERFLGVYSGREISEDEVEVGYVWKPRVISEIFLINR